MTSIELELGQCKGLSNEPCTPVPTHNSVRHRHCSRLSVYLSGKETTATHLQCQMHSAYAYMQEYFYVGQRLQK